MASQTPPEVISHWSTLIENFQVPPLSFYQAVEEALVRREVPQTKNSRVDYREAGALSANREYLRVKRDKLVFDIYAAPFGTGFFVSYWLAEDRVQLNPILRVLAVLGMLGLVGLLLTSAGIAFTLIFTTFVLFGGLFVANMLVEDGTFNDDIIHALPGIGWLYRRLFKPLTYYRIDSMQMFQKAVHNSVMEVVGTMTEGKGIRALAESDRQPVMREFYARQGV